MKILQSYFYNLDERTNKNEKKKFYSYLHSFILLNTYYDDVSVLCDRSGYELFIKYIPYSKFYIIEDKDFSADKYLYYKYETLSKIGNPVICVDGNVHLFKDLISEVNGDLSKSLLIQTYSKMNNFKVNMNLKLKNKLRDLINVNKMLEVKTNVLGFNYDVDIENVFKGVKATQKIIDENNLNKHYDYEVQKYIESKLILNEIHTRKKSYTQIYPNDNKSSSFTKINFNQFPDLEILQQLEYNIKNNYSDYLLYLLKYNEKNNKDFKKSEIVVL